MPRLLIDGGWHEAVSSNAYWEAEYERILLQQSKRLFPEYVAVPFKPTVYSESGSAQADLALVDPGYQLWWVVEVELAHHSLSGHVLPQVTVLARATYGDAEAEYLAARQASLDVGLLREMMKGAQPRVVVIVNQPVDWKPDLSPLGALLTVVEVYRSNRNHHVFRMDGDYPEKPSAMISRCHLDSALARLLVVESPARLPDSADGKYYIEFDGAETVWEPMTSRDRLWLNPLRSNPLSTDASYALVLGEDGRLTIKPER